MFLLSEELQFFGILPLKIKRQNNSALLNEFLIIFNKLKISQMPEIAKKFPIAHADLS